jgi:hypothetical protein
LHAKFIPEGDEMKKQWLTGLAALCLAVCVPNLAAQDKPPTKSPDKPQTTEPRNDEYRFMRASLKVQVVFTEYEGDKKLKSLPYTFLVTTHTRDASGESKVRIGTRVPVYIGGGQNITYLDVGTNIDCRAMTVSTNEYQIFLSLERSWVDGDVSIPLQGVAASLVGGESHTPQFHQPIIRQYRADLSPILRDGQSFETNLATDPLSGRTMKVEVSVATIK